MGDNEQGLLGGGRGAMAGRQEGGNGYYTYNFKFNKHYYFGFSFSSSPYNS